MAKNKTTKT